MIERKHCVITNETDLEFIYSFKNFPALMACVNTPPERDIKKDMDWYISKAGVIQLNPLLPLNILYHDSHGSGTTGNLWKSHHITFSNFISQFNAKKILEIGGGHCELSANYLASHKDTKWTIIEPNPTIHNRHVTLIREFFDGGLKIMETPDMILHSHVFEHVYNPDDFMSAISGNIKTCSYHCFSIPNLQAMLKNKYTNTLNFEHTVFLTENFVEYLLEKYGFVIVKKEYFSNHSIFYATKRAIRPITPPEIHNEYRINKKLFMDFIRFHKNLVINLNKKIETFPGKVYLFGGHIFSQYLIAFGLNYFNIECIIDNDTNKQGKRLYGTELIVNSPDIIVPGSALILRAGIYNEEIKESIIKNNPTVVFWE